MFKRITLLVAAATMTAVMLAMTVSAFADTFDAGGSGGPGGGGGGMERCVTTDAGVEECSFSGGVQDIIGEGGHSNYTYDPSDGTFESTSSGGAGGYPGEDGGYGYHCNQSYDPSTGFTNPECVGSPPFRTE